MKKSIYFILLLFITVHCLKAQTNIVTYAGNGGKETFYDVMQITDGTFLVSGYAENLNWINGSVTKIQLNYSGSIPNALGSNRYGFILHLSSDLKTILQVVHFPQGAVEDIRFMKTNTLPYHPIGDLYISCNTADSDQNAGGYIIAKLDNNFINGLPTALSWYSVVWATSNLKNYHPWDVTSNGKVYYVLGETYGAGWSALQCLDQSGHPTVVKNWRTHWLKNGNEWHGTPVSTNPNGGSEGVSYSAIVLKNWGRCDLRSLKAEDYNKVTSDGNGGTRKGAWPLDFLYSGPCDQNNPTADGPGYTGYYNPSGSRTYGGTCISVDKRNNNLYIGMNVQTVSSSGPDFEPAVISMDSTGLLNWWSRLYYEINPKGDTSESLPDQYVDALAIDYTNDKLVVGARCHGNSYNNFWNGNKIVNNPSAYGFQNTFTGNSGNIHISWLGKFKLANGEITNSTYLAEYAEGTGSLGTPHTDPNLDGWPDPNSGWPNVNTTFLAKNNMKVSSNGDVCVIAVGRRTITTKNAYQKMVKPQYGGKSSWNSFVRVYDSEFHVPKYSSLVVGIWDTLTQDGGGNVDLYGVYKTKEGVICVGRQVDDKGVAYGNNLPTTNVTPWGSSTPQNESAVLVYYKADNLFNSKDDITTVTEIDESKSGSSFNSIDIFPNPASDKILISFKNGKQASENWKYKLTDALGRTVQEGALTNSISLTGIAAGFYQVQIYNEENVYSNKIMVTK